MSDFHLSFSFYFVLLNITKRGKTPCGLMPEDRSLLFLFFCLFLLDPSVYLESSVSWKHYRRLIKT